MKRFTFSILILLLLFFGTTAQPIAIKFANSEMTRFREAWQIDYGQRPHWGYTQGLGSLSMLKMWKKTGENKYYEYVHQFGDLMVDTTGSIKTYKGTNYNVDYINSGKILFDLYKQTGEKKYRMAMDTLLSQLANHPKTSEGVFWHKKIYPHQIWLDGIYMAGPFMAQFGKEFNRPDLIDQAIHEVIVTANRTHDAKTGLFYHAYDESREQRWANKTTGQSPNFWGRAMGWYFMAMVDILDFVPEDHPQRGEIIQIIQNFADAIIKFQDKSGLWYQVLDQGGREKNYLEASVSSMFMYSLAKSVNKGYLPKKYKKVALKTLEGIKSKLLVENADGTLSLTQCCAVAGLGGNPYRDGSYEYYVNEKIRNNDAKATGPFIMGCLELRK